MILNTVNVIDFSNLAECSITALNSYSDDAEGNKQAEAVFAEWVRTAKGDEQVTDEDMESYLEDGICEIGEGAIVITHSTQTG